MSITLLDETVVTTKEKFPLPVILLFGKSDIVSLEIPLTSNPVGKVSSMIEPLPSIWEVGNER